MNRKHIGGLLALLVILGVGWFFMFRKGGETTKVVDTTARPAEVKPATTTAAKQPESAAPRGMAPKWSLDEDPVGPLTLEGQVQGPDGKGVGKAKVWLGSVPPRSAVSEDDGTFTFDKLVGRTYAVSASSGDLIGGPVSYKLTDKSDPVVIRMTEGATVNVTVIDEAAKPIEGADVKEDAEHTAKTDKDGKATLKPVRPGWVGVEASADGYAPSSSFTTIGSAGATGALTITLRKGYGVAGKVVDEAGKPIAKARVSVDSNAWGFGNATEPVTTDDKGQFQFAALAAGSQVLVAIDGEHAPARSAPITVKDRPVSGIVITMKAGAVLAGKVVGTDGKPVAFATVRVAGKGANAWQQTARQTTSDQAGAFELRGLARGKLQARAESDSAASKLADADLSDKAEIKDLTLVLDVAGRIAGTVVDDKGAPVAEVQVNAFPDILGGGNTEGLALAGMSSTTTDGGGAFVIHGLPDGAYKLWAARSTDMFQEWGQHGTAAKTGDTGVKIVLPAPGELKGTIVLDGATTPPSPASVQLGQQPPTPAKDGAFTLRGVSPGTYDVIIRGLQFAQLTKRDVKIEPGKTTDLGAITVFRGRRLSGKVVDKTGAGVAGAKVKIGDMLFSSEGNEDQWDSVEDMYGIRSAVSDQAGEFTIIGVSKKATQVLADHPDRGRSSAVALPEGTDDPAPITLTLRGYGSVTGKVTMKGKPQARVTVSQSTKNGGAAASFVQTGDDGTFTMAKVPEGTIVIQAVQQQMMSMKTTAVSVTVTAGKQATVNIDIPVGELALAVTIQPMPNNQVDAAQVFLFSGVVAPKDGKQLTDGFFQGGGQGMKFWLGKGMPMPEFDELVAGDYSICTIPITGSLADPTFQQRLQENLAALRVYCKVVKVAPSPAKQAVTQEVPAMTPLPAPTN